jgi:hypothetical protein
MDGETGNLRRNGLTRDGVRFVDGILLFAAVTYKRFLWLEGHEGWFDRRGIPSPKRVLLKTVEELPRLNQEQLKLQFHNDYFANVLTIPSGESFRIL